MKIAMLLERWGAETEAERYVAGLADRLVDRGHTLEVLTRAGRHQPTGQRFTITSQHESRMLPSLGLLRYVRWARTRIARADFDVTFSASSIVPADVVAPIAGLHATRQRTTFARMPSLRSRVRRRLRQWRSAHHWQRKLLEEHAMRSPQVRRFIAATDHAAEELAARYAIDASRVETIADGSTWLNHTSVDPAASRQRLRDAYGLGDDGLVLLFASHDPWHHGITALCESLKRLANRPIMVLIAGSVSHGLTNLIAREGVRDMVRFVGPTTRWAELFSAIDVTVLPTHFEPASTLVLDSLRMGRPAITTRRDGASRWVVPATGEPRGCVIDDPSDIDGLTAAIASMLDRDKRARMTEACADADLPDPNDHVDRLEALLRQVAQG